MKTETKALLTLKGTLSSISRVEKYISSMIDSGNTEIEEKIINSNKTINDCWKYVCFKAKEMAGTDNNVCIDDNTVYGWAVHYYEDNESAEKEMNPPKPKIEKKEDKAKKVKASENETSKVEVLTDIVEGQVTFGETEEKTEEVEELKKEEVQDLSFDDIEIAPVNGEDRKCIICQKKMKDAYAGKPIDTIRRWTDKWLKDYGVVFCCKEHFEEYQKMVKESEEINNAS